MEIWKTIDDYPNYMVSNMGRVKSKINGKEKILKPVIRSGYNYVNLGRKCKIGIHVLVAKHFPDICGKWFNGCCVHHKNNNRKDNNPENLMILSIKDHHKLHYKELPETFTKPSPKRSKSISIAKKGRVVIEKHIPILQFDKEMNFIKKWDCGAYIAKTLNKSQGNITSCCKGILKTAYGFKWQYADEYEKIPFKVFDLEIYRKKTA